MKKLLIALSLIMLLASCQILKVNSSSPIYAMDTIINVTLYNDSNYEKHYEDIKAIYNYYDKISSNFTSNDCLSIKDLNDKRELVVDDSLIELLNYSKELEILSNGYFNIRLGKLNNYWKNLIKNKEANIDDNKIKELLAEANNTSIEIVDNRVKITGDGDIDLGGIAKGYATQKALEYLKDNNVGSYLINAGDSNILLGTKGNDNDFNVGLSKPYSDGIYLALRLKNVSIGTSSPKYQYYELNNIKYHHIINPYTGYPMNYYDSVTIISDNSAIVDCLSTAIFSMSLDTAIQFINDNNIKAVLYKDNSVVYKSEGL